MKRIQLLLIVLFGALTVNAQKTQLGTEIWIEPGYTKTDIIGWVRQASEAGFKDIRIFMMWTHVEPQLDKWDFEVYDWMFDACAKYHLKLQVTLNPNQPAWHYGKEYWGSIHSHGIFSDPKMKEAAAKYIKMVVERYKDSPALDYWWLMNEPYPSDNESPIKLVGFKKEMKEKYHNIQALNKLWNSNFNSFDEIKDIKAIYSAEWAAAVPYYDWTNYSNHFLTDFQHWVRDEVYRYDNRHRFTTNPGAYLSLYHRQEASEWMPFLDAFGLSIHPIWHFDMFTNEQYDMGVAATCELGRSVASPKPFWVAELSGGNSIFYFCPSANEIAQWTWTGIAEGAQKIIYWLLNARTSGNESGEWALLDFQNEPTDRLNMAINIAGCLNQDSVFFNKAKPLESNVSILLNRESSLIYARKKQGEEHIEAVMSCYQALAEKGISVKLEQTQDFPWAKSSGKAVILPSMITIPDILVDSIKTFLRHGNKLIVLGPTGYYNEKEDCQFLKFPFKDEFGAQPKEIRSIQNSFSISTMDGKYHFEVSKNFGIINNLTATSIALSEGNITGIRNKTGNSEVVWIPSNIDLGAWKSDNSELSQFLSDELIQYTKSQPFEFVNKTKHVGMRTLINGQSYLTVINNGDDAANIIRLKNKLNKKPSILFCTDKTRKEINPDQQIILSPKECLVILWN